MKNKDKKIAEFYCSREPFWPKTSRVKRTKFWFVFLLIYFSLVFSNFVKPQSSLALSSWEEELIFLTNQTRIENGLSPLYFSEKLYRSALAKAYDMKKARYFDHFSPQGKSPWKFLEEESYQYFLAGENLAIGFSETREILKSWLASQDHRKNILDPEFEEIGIAVLPLTFEGDFTSVVVEFLGKR